MKEYLGRRAVLKDKINRHLSSLTKIEKDYFSSLEEADLLKLKSVLTDINNVLTLKLTLKAADWLGKIFKIRKAILTDIIIDIDKQKPNTAGFDICINAPNKIIGEVKCVVPVNDGASYGAAQWNGILDDVIKLKNGCKKIPDTSTFFKFIFLLDLGEKTDKAIEKLMKQSKGVSENQKRLDRHDIKYCIEIFEKSKQMSLDKVYVVKLS